MQVEPIRDREKFILMQQMMLDDEKYTEWLLFQFLFFTNLRISDAINLHWSDLVEDKKIKSAKINIKQKKTGIWTSFRITEKFRESIEFYIEKKKKENQISFNGFIFRSPKKWKKNPLSYTYFYKFIKSYGKKAGVWDNVGTHTPRKTAGRIFYEQFGIGETMKLLGHTSEKHTLRYIGITEERLSQARQNLSDWMI